VGRSTRIQKGKTSREKGNSSSVDENQSLAANIGFTRQRMKCLREKNKNVAREEQKPALD